MRSGARAGETREGGRWAKVHKRVVRTELSAEVIEAKNKTIDFDAKSVGG